MKNGRVNDNTDTEEIFVTIKEVMLNTTKKVTMRRKVVRDEKKSKGSLWWREEIRTVKEKRELFMKTDERYVAEQVKGKRKKSFSSSSPS